MQDKEIIISDKGINNQQSILDNKKNVVRFNYKNMSNEAYVTYHEVVGGIFVKFGAEKIKQTGIEKLFMEYNRAYANVVSVLDVIQKSAYTKEIEAQDRIRDRKCYALVTAVKLAIIDEIEGADKVEMVINYYGNIARRGYDKETAAIDDLIRELRDNWADEIKSLNLADRLKDLEVENAKFKELMDKRYVEIAQRSDINMRNARQLLDNIFRAILNFFEAMTILSEDPIHNEFAKELNAVSTRYKNILAQQKGKRDKKKENLIDAQNDANTMSL